jgi:hypothetical protein
MKINSVKISVLGLVALVGSSFILPACKALSDTQKGAGLGAIAGGTIGALIGKKAGNTAVLLAVQLVVLLVLILDVIWINKLKKLSKVYQVQR